MKKEFISTIVRFSVSVVIILFLFVPLHVIHANVFLQYSTQQDSLSYKEFKGVIIDSNTKRPLSFADLTVNTTNIRTVTNKDGEFLLKVPNSLLNRKITISFLGYEKLEIKINDLKNKNNRIALSISIIKLNQVKIKVPKDAETLVKITLKKEGVNYFNDQAVMTGFYRETIKKRNKNASLSEAVVEIYKEPYKSKEEDAIRLIKSRKNTNYSKLDTLALKLQGGPFSAIYTDIIKYPEYIFSEGTLPYYDFSFEPSTQINDRQVYVVKFKQHPNVVTPLYYGKLFIDTETFALTSAIYNLNIENRALVSALFIRKKPKKVKVYPTKASYRVDYKTKDGRWYYGYSNIQLAFKVKWKNKLFSSTYSLNIEMAITDWKKNETGKILIKNPLKPTVILSDEASGFSDPKFWGKYNIIEPEKSIESAIKKIAKQLKRQK